MALSTRRIWESSFLCSREKLPLYPSLRQGEDTSVIEEIFVNGRIALMDFLSLYLRISRIEHVPGQPLEQHWQEATASLKVVIYDVKIQELSQRLKLDLTDWLEKASTFSDADQTTSPSIKPPPPIIEAAKTEDASFEKTSRSKVLILCLAMNVARFLPRLWENLKSLVIHMI